MAVEVVFHHDIIEEILIRSDVEALVRFKRVCKSWQSLICDDRFIKAHLNHNSKKKVHRRIVISSSDNMPKKSHWYPYKTKYNYLVGSSNGLVCIYSSHNQVLVANPLTRDMKKLPNPKNIDKMKRTSVWGFGYDSSTDDYKVIVGSISSYFWTSFQVLSLKTNVWKDVGTLKYTKLNYMCHNFFNFGILCNGKLHWFMIDQNAKKDVILSFDVSEEKFEEIPQPDEFKCSEFCNLGISEGCLCICDSYQPIWVMKNYNVRESWVSFQYTLENDNDVVYSLRPINDSLSHTSFFTNDDVISSWTWDVNCAFIFVCSLVSPHVNGKLKRKRDAENTDQLIEGDHLVT